MTEIVTKKYVATDGMIFRSKNGNVTKGFTITLEEGDDISNYYEDALTPREEKRYLRYKEREARKAELEERIKQDIEAARAEIKARRDEMLAAQANISDDSEPVDED